MFSCCFDAAGARAWIPQRFPRNLLRGHCAGSFFCPHRGSSLPQVVHLVRRSALHNWRALCLLALHSVVLRHSCPVSLVSTDHDHHNTGLVWIDSSVYQARRAPSTELVESYDEVRW